MTTLKPNFSEENLLQFHPESILLGWFLLVQDNNQSLGLNLIVFQTIHLVLIGRIPGHLSKAIRRL